MIPAMIIPGILFTILGLYPFLEAWVTGDKREHHLLDRPRNVPVRTGIGVMAITFYVLLWIGGGNDIIATQFHLSINEITWTLRILLFVAPPIAFVITRRIALALQRRDREKLLHGYETGTVLQLPSGEFIEVHAPVSQEERAVLTAGESYSPVVIDDSPDENGVTPKIPLGARTRAKLSRFYFGEQVERPTEAEIEAAEHHAHELAESQQAQIPSGSQEPSAALTRPSGDASQHGVGFGLERGHGRGGMPGDQVLVGEEHPTLQDVDAADPDGPASDVHPGGHGRRPVPQAGGRIEVVGQLQPRRYLLQQQCLRLGLLLRPSRLRGCRTGRLGKLHGEHVHGLGSVHTPLTAAGEGLLLARAKGDAGDRRRLRARDQLTWVQRDRSASCLRRRRSAGLRRCGRRARGCSGRHR